MEATLRAGVLKSLLECTKDLWSTANFVFSENGLQLRAMDSSHVALVSLTLSPSAFSSFCCPQKTTLGIQFDALSIVLKSFASEDQINLEFALNSDHVTIRRGDDRQWELKLLDIEEDEISIPNQTYDKSAKLCSAELHKCLRDLKDLNGETIVISLDESGACFSVEGQLGKGTAAITRGISIEGNVNVKCSYCMRYLAAFAKGSSLCPTISLRLGRDTPICVAYDLEDKGSLEFYLAPRLEED